MGVKGKVQGMVCACAHVCVCCMSVCVSVGMLCISALVYMSM